MKLSELQSQKSMSPCYGGKHSLKIVFLLSNPGLGGVERRLAWIVPLMNQRGHDVRIYNLREESKAHALWQASDVPLKIIPGGGMSRTLVVRRLVHELRRDRPDVIHIHGLRANLIGRIAATIAGVPVVVSGQVSTDDWRRWYHVAADRLTSPLVTCYTTNSNAVRNAFLNREKIAPKRIVTIHNGIDVDRYVAEPEWRDSLRIQWGIRPDDTLFLMIANVRPAKDHIGLLSAVEELHQSETGFKVVLIGEDHGGGNLQREIESRRLEGVVMYLGPQPDAARLWPAADVALLCSHWEGFPFSLLEAMATGLPVLATRVGGVDELVQDGKTGLIVPASEPEAFCDAMRELLRQPRRRKQLGVAGRDRAGNEFGMDSMLDRLSDLYQTAIRVEKGACSEDAFRNRTLSPK